MSKNEWKITPPTEEAWYMTRWLDNVCDTEQPSYWTGEFWRCNGVELEFYLHDPYIVNLEWFGIPLPDAKELGTLVQHEQTYKQLRHKLAEEIKDLRKERGRFTPELTVKDILKEYRKKNEEATLTMAAASKLAHEVLRETLHGPVPMKTAMKLAMAVEEYRDALAASRLECEERKRSLAAAIKLCPVSTGAEHHEIEHFTRWRQEWDALYIKKGAVCMGGPETPTIDIRTGEPFTDNPGKEE